MDAKREEEGAQRVALLLAGLGQEVLEGLDTVGARLPPDEEVGRLEVELGSEVGVPGTATWHRNAKRP